MTNNKFSGDKPARSSVESTGIRPAGLAGKVRLRAGTADAVLAVVPHLLGFYPTRSLVVLGLGDRNRVMVTFRYDLPDPPDTELADDIADHAQFVLDRERISAAMLVGYGPDDLVAPVIITTASRLAHAGVEMHEVLLADAGRFWSLLCADPSCCPAEGRRYDPGSHPAAAAMSSAGLTVYPDREALARSLQRPAGAADRIARATNAAQGQLGELLSRSKAAGDADPQLRVSRVGRKAVQRAIKTYRSGRSISDTSELTWLAVLLDDLRVRDDAWARMDPAHHEDHRRLWTDVIRSAAQDHVAAPASLLAFTAWQAGNGALASVAIERALRADPDYSMAKLLARAIEAALPPSAAQMPMRPAEVAASYAQPPVRSRRGEDGRAATLARRRRAAPGGRSGRAGQSVGGGQSAPGAAGGQNARPGHGSGQSARAGHGGGQSANAEHGGGQGANADHGGGQSAPGARGGQSAGGGQSVGRGGSAPGKRGGLRRPRVSARRGRSQRSRSQSRA